MKLFAGALWKIIDDKYSIKKHLSEIIQIRFQTIHSVGALKRTMIFIICYNESMITCATPCPPVMVMVLV